MKSRDFVRQFLDIIKKDELIMKLFHFVICTSREEIHEQLQEIMGWENPDESSGHDKKNDRPKPTAGNNMTTLLSHITNYPFEKKCI